MKNSNHTKAESINAIQPTALTDVLDLADIQRFQDLFADVHGVASLITDPKGQPITQPSNFTSLCADIIRKTEKAAPTVFNLMQFWGVITRKEQLLNLV
ncbi:PAS/PAC sensor hybrid histidine kinase [Geofilum rubicundum JCM 15548]|uniref:PAS/PAC sensor hybrid histidine kinase n=1 Tax=Geofilum rubicundum JCM 15548 TaxID=1236989 RepID=A0A0E9M394_9BACT|nr:PAS/PAC sensor hybrid histidine kinase [Geofilum rubicundum JCM 15548]